MPKWTARDIPPQHGRTVVVTGANSGLGYMTALELARAGAHVVLACRDPRRGEAARAALTRQVPAASVDLRRLDLASLTSVREFAEALRRDHPRLDVLINNAGIMAIPRQLTDDGFERQLGTNHLGHFALTGLLLPALLPVAGSRVVTVSSGAHKTGRMNFDDLMGERSYRRWVAYSQSKLANLLFAFELHRRLTSAGAATISVAAHPGYAATNLQHVGPRIDGNRLAAAAMSIGNRLLAQSDEMGALPQLYAATSPDVAGGDYLGPDGLLEQRGHPRKVSATRAARDEAAAARLWSISEDLTGVTFPVAGPAPTTAEGR
jgi:NAD(P)-dependent dehydrogenase (short-subunit alcohol dehydrogenase family)